MLGEESFYSQIAKETDQEGTITLSITVVSLQLIGLYSSTYYLKIVMLQCVIMCRYFNISSASSFDEKFFGVFGPR